MQIKNGITKQQNVFHFQGYGKVSMMESMVVAAINWMKAGLPLRLLKIVLYANIVEGQVSQSTLKEYKGVCDRFAELKERYDSQYLVPKVSFPSSFFSICFYLQGIQSKGSADSQIQLNCFRPFNECKTQV